MQQLSSPHALRRGVRRPARLSIGAAAAAAVLGWVAPASALSLQEQPVEATVRPQDDAGAREASSPVIARGGGLALTRGEFLPLLLDRFGAAGPGADLLKLLISTRVLDLMGREQGLSIDAAAITRRWRELDEQVKASGIEGGIDAEIAQRGLEPEEFREYLRLQLLQEELTRRALELEPGTPIGPDSQEVWLAQTIVDRGVKTLPPPWSDGVVAKGGGVTVTTDELGDQLLSKLDPIDVREAAWHLLLLRGLERRMPDLSAEARAGALEREMQRRREKAEAAVAAQGAVATFEELLRQRGTSFDALARDPSVAIAALTRLWVDRNQGPAGLRRTYESERDYFDGRFGVALRTHALLLVAGEFKNDIVKRTYEEADAELEALKADLVALDDFRAYAATYSEDPSSRSRKGELGWIAREDPGFPESVRLPLFEFYDALPDDPLRPETKHLSASNAVVGPIRFEAGSALLHVSALRPTPAWEQMSEIVHEELRRRLIEELLPVDSVELVLQ